MPAHAPVPATSLALVQAPTHSTHLLASQLDELLRGQPGLELAGPGAVDAVVVSHPGLTLVPLDEEAVDPAHPLQARIHTCMHRFAGLHPGAASVRLRGLGSALPIAGAAVACRSSRGIHGVCLAQWGACHNTQLVRPPLADPQVLAALVPTHDLESGSSSDSGSEGRGGGGH